MRPLILVAVAAAVAVGFWFVRRTSHDADEANKAPAVAVAEEEPSPPPAPVAPIEPGTRINPHAPPDGLHLVFRSRPKLTSGDVDKVRKSIRQALETFTTLVVVRTEPDPDRPGRFRRGPFAVGIGMPEGEADVVLTKASADRFGIALGFFDGRVLAEREKELATVRSPGTTPTMALFDFRTDFLRDGRRVEIVLRYAALVDPADGDLAAPYWVLDATPDGYRFFGDSLRLLPPNHSMDWELHVDGGKLTLGAPRADALSAVKLPQGTELPADAELKTAAAARSFTAATAARLEQMLREVLDARRTSPAVGK